MLSTDEIRDHYDQWHRQRADGEDVSRALVHPWHRSVAPFLRQYGQGAKILEIGCGRGDFAIWMARELPDSHITGVDFSPGAIEIATERARGMKNVRFEVGDALKLPLYDWSYDFVVSCECLEHVVDPYRMAKEINRVLRGGGHFVLTTENYFNAMTLMWLKAKLTRTPYNSGSSVQPHENYFLYWRVRSILENANLEVDVMRSNHFQWLLLPRTDPGRLCTEEFESPFLNRLFRPFGRHFTYFGRKLY